MKHIKKQKMFVFLMLITIASTVGFQTWRTVFNNFAVDIVGLNGNHIGTVQSIREIPGFLALLAIYVMMVLKEHRIVSLSILIMGIGVAAVGFFPSYIGVICTTLIMSFGFHYYETMNQSLSLQYFDKNTAPLVLGSLKSYGAATNIVVGIILFAISTYLDYRTIFLIAGLLLVGVSIWSFSVNPTDPEKTAQRKTMIFRKRYWLFYFLTMMAGARRQIFIAFAVFLLVKKFEFSIQEIALLFLVNNLINYFLAPLVGKFIIRFGERRILSLEYSSLILIFIAYAFVESKLMVAVLYIADHVFYNFAIAINTFFQKIADPKDIAPSMAVGFTINHIAAVILPVVGGILWMVDYRIPFYGGAALSLLSLIGVQFITSQLKQHTGQKSQNKECSESMAG